MAFHNALETAVKEVQMTKDLQNMHLDSSQMLKLDSLIHRLSAQNNAIRLEDFFNSQYDEMQFDEMLSLVERYLETGDNTVFSDMVDLKNQFTMDSVPHEETQETAEILQNGSFPAPEVTAKPELTKLEQAFISTDYDLDLFLAKSVLNPEQLEILSRHFFEEGYSRQFSPDENKVFGNALPETELYNLLNRRKHENVAEPLAKGLLGSQELFVTPKGYEFYAEYGENSITVHFGNAERQISYDDMGEAFGWLFEEKYEEIENERAKQIQLEKEKNFLNADIAPIMAKSVLAWDEIEDIGYLFFEENYLERHKPSESSIFGNGMPEAELYDLAVMSRNGEDVRKQVAIGLLGGQKRFSLNNDSILDKNEEIQAEYGENAVTLTFGSAKREIDYKELGDAFYQLIKNEHDDIVHGRTMEDLQYIIPNLSDEMAEKLIQTFDESSRPDWENNLQKKRQIKRALYEILGDDEQVEKAFASIAYLKYDYKEPVKPDFLEFRFGGDKDEDWFTESELLAEIAEQNPEMSFTLANAVMEYLDEKQHLERNIKELHAGWYNKTNFEITINNLSRN